MPSFAERMGHRTARSIVQIDGLDADNRTQLWNVSNILRTILLDAERRDYSKTGDNLLAAVWAWEFKKAADEQPHDSQIWGEIKKRILQGHFIDALDLIEAIVGYTKRYEDTSTSDVVPAIVGAFNDRFEQYLVGFRFIGLEITPIDSTTEAKAVSTAIDESSSIKGARHHLERAVELLADRQTPDYANSIKESISAVEAICVAVTAEHTLGAGLKRLKGAGLKIHPALESAWSKMYGWTSDADGIRHGSIDAPDADQALAKYMLVTCSAFVSYLIEAGRKTDLTQTT